MSRAKFGTAVNCMDGRVQEPVARWMQTRRGVQFVDVITAPGPIKYLAENIDLEVKFLKKMCEVSVTKHHSKVIAVAGHHDCAGNPLKRKEQIEQVKLACELVHSWYPQTEVIGLYVNEIWQVEEIGTVK